MRIARDPVGEHHAKVEFGADAPTARSVAAIVDRKHVGVLHVLLIPMRCTGINVDNLLPADLPLLFMMSAAADAILAQQGQPRTSSYVGFHLPPHTSEDTLHCHVIGTRNVASGRVVPLTPDVRHGFSSVDMFCPIETVIRHLRVLQSGECTKERHAEYVRALRRR